MDHIKQPAALTWMELLEITRREVALYAGQAFDADLYALNDELQHLYTVVVVPHLPREFPARVVVMAQVVGDHVVILEDTTDKPLVEALMINGGVPREQIVLAYEGETLSTSDKSE